MDNGVVRCLDPKTGQQIWQSRLGNAFVSSPLYANGLIYLCSTKGLTTVLRPGGKPDPIAENRLDGRFMASPAVSGNALFLRTDTHLYRVEN
jgi:outer membrane protein assembly factor BamB